METLHAIRVAAQLRRAFDPAIAARQASTAIRHGLAWSVLLLAALLGSLTVPAHAASASGLQTLTINSRALGERTQVNVLLPDGYATGTKRYPVLYLLHGFGGSYGDWVQQTDIVQFARKLPLIVVMPDGDSGWYMDPQVYGPKWETYHIDELIPYVDSHFRTVAARNGRAVAGLSMGGMGAISYAERHPDLFVAAASFSGVLDLQHFRPLASGMRVISAEIFGSICGGDEWCVRAHDPVELASNLRGLHVFLSCGNGTPGPFDKNGEPDDMEVQIHKTFVSMVGALRTARIPADVHDYGAGTHTWPYWQRELHRAMPMLLAALAGQPAAPATWSYRTADAVASVWGYTMSVTGRSGDGGFTDLTAVGLRGFTVTGSGTVSLITAPVYKAGRPYTIARDASRQVLRADAHGRLHVIVRLDSRTSTARISIDSTP